MAATDLANHLSLHSPHPAKPQTCARADVWLKTDVPSDLGEYSYLMIDTKLALATKAETILQLCLHAELVAAIQGTLPAKIGVVTPDHFRTEQADPEWYRTLDYMACFRHVKARLVESIEAAPATYPDPVTR